MKKFILLFTTSIVLIGVNSCACCRPISHTQSTAMISKHQLQRLEKDTVHVHDSIIIQHRHDTVFVDRWHTAWRERLVCRTDTIVDTQEVIVEKNIEKRVVPRWCWWLLGANVLLILILGLIGLQKRFG